MTQAKNPLNPFDWFNYVFTYLPTTNWQHAFSPTVNFGCNVEDAQIEQHVVDSVGSYGFQLNRVLDALSVIIDKPTPKGRSAEDSQKIEAFKELARAADAAAKEYEGEATETRVEKLIEDMNALKQTDPVRYQKLKDQIWLRLSRRMVQHPMQKGMRTHPLFPARYIDIC